MAEKPAGSRLLGLAAKIVSAHAANNDLETSELPGIIRVVYAALGNTDQPEPPAPPRAEPAVPIEESVFSEYIICLEDGKQLKMLKRHLAAAYNMTPEQYRAKWGLDARYPMVASDYASKRSALAKKIGLGRRSED